MLYTIYFKATEHGPVAHAEISAIMPAKVIWDALKEAGYIMLSAKPQKDADLDRLPSSHYTNSHLPCYLLLYLDSTYQLSQGRWLKLPETQQLLAKFLQNKEGILNMGKNRNTEADVQVVAAAYGFDRLEANVVATAAKRLGINVWSLADKVYGWCILNMWDRNDWSVQNIVTQYNELVKEYN